MFRFFYQWRYRQSQKAGAFKIPGEHSIRSHQRANRASYLSQSSVRGRQFARFDLPYRRKTWVRFAIAILSLSLVAWLIFESIRALSIFGN